MKLPRRDRSSVRTAKDIERKYDLESVSKNREKLEMNTEAIDRLNEENRELLIRQSELENKVSQNKTLLELLNENKADKDELPDTSKFLTSNDLKNYYDKNKIDSLLYEAMAVRKVMYYRTIEPNEVRIRLPTDYKIDCIVDVFVNGLKLEKSKFDVITHDEIYYLQFEEAFEEIGTRVEVDMIENLREVVF